MVVAYQNQIESLQQQAYYHAQDTNHHSPKISIHRYEKLLADADSERAGLLNEISLLSK